MRRISERVILWLLPLVLGAGGASAWDELMVITSDYSTFGGVVAVERYAPWQVSGDLDTVGSDAVARFHAGLYYVVNRSAGTIQILDPADGYHTVREYSLGAGLNLQDIAFGPDGMAYVSCYEAAVLLKIDPQAGIIIQSISTAGFADADGLPETAWMQAVGTRLFITCQRLDADNFYLPTGASTLLVYDMAVDAWVDVDPGTAQIDPILLSRENPYAQLELSSDRTRLKIGSSGRYTLADGGVEVIDPVSLTSLGLEMTEAQLGGDILDFVTISEDLVYVIVSDASFRTAVKSYSPLTGAVGLVELASGFDHADLAYDGDEQLYLADRALGRAGIRVFDAASGQELTTTPQATGLPPVWIVLPVDDAVVAVAEAPLMAPLRLDAPWPNPGNPAMHLRFRGPEDSAVQLTVCDLRGRCVRAARLSTGADGTGSWLFDGRDDRGRLLASGVYRAVVSAGAQRTIRTLTLLR